MKDQSYTAVRDGDGKVTSLQFWSVQGQPSVAQILQVSGKFWPQVVRRHPERLIFSQGFNHFSVSVQARSQGLPLVEEKPF